MTNLFLATGLNDWFASGLGVVQGVAFVVSGVCLVGAVVITIINRLKRKDK